jgi:hypothetical protein
MNANDIIQNQAETKVIRILTSLQNGMELKKVATIMGFADAKDLAEYMRSRGYKWASELSAYIQAGSVGSGSYSNEVKSNGKEIQTIDESPQNLMQFLEKHKEKLVEILTDSMPQVPRYILPGINRTKSFFINHGLEVMTKEYSVEKNVSQKDIIEVALVEFFKRYGYKNEILRLLER